MDKKGIVTAFLLAAGLLGTPNVQAQRTYEEMEQLTVNEQVTTVITASEPVRFVDISTDKVVGDQPIDNIVRLKPKEGGHEDGEVLAIVTIVTERYRTQYALLYTTRVREAVTDKEIQLQERNAYHNPAVSMSTVDMTRFARRIWNSPAKIRNVATKAHRMTMRLNNIYTVGEYFFIDFSIENRTNIRFDIDEIRVKLADKKLTKATNAQVIELVPELVLETGKTFRHGYRNVVVVRKMTFPNDKVLTIEMTEKQISGRAISLNIDNEKDDYPDDCLHVPRRRRECTTGQRPPFARSGAAVQERAGRDAGLRTRDELPPCVGVLCQRLPAMGRVRILQACMPEIFLAELPHLQLRRGLQTLRHEGTQPLRKPPNRGFGRKRHEEVPCRTAFRLRAQLCVAGGLDAILASQGRRDDKGGRCAAYRSCPRY